MRLWVIAAVATVATTGTFAKPLEETFAQFHWDKDGKALEAFEVELEEPGKIQIVDFKMNGDAFGVYDNDQLIGKTPAIDPLAKGNAFAATTEEAESDARFSQGVYDLDKGRHVITIRSLGTYESGTGAIRLIPRLQKMHRPMVAVNNDAFHGYQHGTQPRFEKDKLEETKDTEIIPTPFDDTDYSSTITTTETLWVLETPSPRPSVAASSSKHADVSLSLSMSQSLPKSLRQVKSASSPK